MGFLDAISIEERREIENKIKDIQSTLNEIGKKYNLAISVCTYSLPPRDDYACAFVHYKNKLRQIENLSDIEGCLDKDDAWSDTVKEDDADE